MTLLIDRNLIGFSRSDVFHKLLVPAERQTWKMDGFAAAWLVCSTTLKYWNGGLVIVSPVKHRSVKMALRGGSWGIWPSGQFAATDRSTGRTFATCWEAPASQFQAESAGSLLKLAVTGHATVAFTVTGRVSRPGLSAGPRTGWVDRNRTKTRKKRAELLEKC